MLGHSLAPFADFSGDMFTAFCLLNANYAKDWPQLQNTGEVQTGKWKPLIKPPR